jgi:hypothetical protein
MSRSSWLPQKASSYSPTAVLAPRVVLLVNESMLLPVLMPLAPAATLPVRVADEVAAVLRAPSAAGVR